MINLDEIFNKTIDFQLHGELIKVQQPSEEDMREISLLSQHQENPEVLLDKQNDIIIKIMNKNSSARKFNLKEVKSWPMSVKVAIIQAIAESIKASSKN